MTEIKKYPLEDEEQELVIQYLGIKNIKYSSIPNSTYTTSWNQKAKNKRLGLRPGLPDLLMIIKEDLVFIEMKRVKGGTISVVQKEWLEALNKCDGVNAYVCKGFDEAKIVIDKHITKNRNKELLKPYKTKETKKWNAKETAK